MTRPDTTLKNLRNTYRTEQNTSKLQPIDNNFYSNIGTQLNELRRERDEKREHVDDPFTNTDVQKLTTTIENIETTVENIYKCRQGKILRMAGLTASGMMNNAENLTEHETIMFENIVTAIQTTRDEVLTNATITTNNDE